jgi:hypothetical protein
VSHFVIAVPTVIMRSVVVLRVAAPLPLQVRFARRKSRPSLFQLLFYSPFLRRGYINRFYRLEARHSLLLRASVAIDNDNTSMKDRTG